MPEQYRVYYDIYPAEFGPKKVKTTTMLHVNVTYEELQLLITEGFVKEEFQEHVNEHEIVEGKSLEDIEHRLGRELRGRYGSMICDDPII